MMYNILYIVAEELRANTLGCYGNTFCPTPNLDRLAQKGVVFENCFTVHGKCVPSRIAMINGTYPSALGCRDLFTYPSSDCPENMVQYLKRTGHRTGLFGKNHVVPSDRLHETFAVHPPRGNTFQQYRLADYDSLPPLRKALYQGVIDAPLEETRDWITVDQFESFAAADTSRPFFAWVNFENSHPPYSACEPFFGSLDRNAMPSPIACDFDDKPAFMKTLHHTWCVNHLSRDELIEIKATYHEQVMTVDHMVGRLLDLLERHNLLESTIIVFTSDHGDWAGNYGLVEKWDTAFHDDLLHVPLIINVPGISERRSDSLVESIDILPTILELADLPGHGTAQHAQSFAGTFRDEEGHSHRPDVYAEGGIEPTALSKLTPCPHPTINAYTGKHQALHNDPMSLASARMLRTREHKLVLRSVGVNELYDLDSDPNETRNLYGNSEYMDIQLRLTERLGQRMMTAAPRWPRLPEEGITA